MVAENKSSLTRKMLNSVMAGVLACGLCLGATGCSPSSGNSTGEAIEEAEAPLASLADNKLTIKAGAATPVANKANYYNFPHLTVESASTQKIKSITVQFTSAITANDEVYLSDSGNFKVFDKDRHGNKSVNNDAGATAEEWQEYLQKNLEIKLANTETTQSLRMVASFDKVTATYDYNAENGHYYLGVSKTLTWSQALAEAAKYEYLGMKGYLVTLTSEKETAFIQSLVKTDSWLGGTCDRNYMKDADGNFYKDLPASTFQLGSFGIYYWVTGPEAGQAICRSSLTGSPRSRTIYNGPDGKPMFENWNAVQPDGATGHDSTGEKYMQIYYSNSTWNDLPGNYSLGSYVVEFGGLPSDKTDDAAVDADVDVYVKVDINIDPSGRTITTEAYNTTVGTDPVIRENVNGDEEIKTISGESTKEADVTRTFYVKDATATATDGWRQLTADDLNENGFPVHAGDYKVVSSAVYKEATGDGQPEMFKSGEATFSIKPATLKMADLEKPLVTKVYDGTDAIAVADIDISSLLVDGAKVTLKATSAKFNNATVKGATKVTLTGAVLEGADASDYALELEGEGEVKTTDIKAAITPRDLVITATSNVNWGLEGQPLKAADGSDISYKSNLAVHSTRDWLPNELAARDAIDGDVTKTILGALTFSAKAGNAELDTTSPVKGLYNLKVHYANLNPNQGGLNTQAEESSADNRTADKSTVRLMAEGDEENSNANTNTETTSTTPAPASTGLDTITVRTLEDGRYDIGNYLVALNGDQILITDDPYAENGFEDVTKFKSGTHNETVDPEAQPLTQAELLELIKEINGGKLPEGNPTIVITKNGVPVETIDPTEVGSYAIMATYPNPNGADEVIRVGYNVLQNAPFEMDEEVTVKATDEPTAVTKDSLAKLVEGLLEGWVPAGVTPVTDIKGPDGQPVNEIDLSKPGDYQVTFTYVDEKGVARQVNLLYHVKEDAEATIIEDVNLPIDPNGKPISGDEVAKRIQDSYPELIPDGLTSRTTITKDGETVTSINPTQKGTYDIVVEYLDAEGNVVKVVKTTYNFVEDPAADDDDGNENDNANAGLEVGSRGPEENGDQQTTPTDPNATGDNTQATGDTQSGAKGFKGFADNAQRFLAQTGDPVFLAGCGIAVLAVIAGVVLVVTRRKNKQQ